MQRRQFITAAGMSTVAAAAMAGSHAAAGDYRGWKQPALTHKYRLLERPPHRTFKGGRE